MPHHRWATRIALPLAVLTVVASLLAYSGREALRSGVEVHVVPVVMKPAAASEPGLSTLGSESRGAGAIIQAPGWIEADPFAVSVSALVAGVIEDVLVLEGDRISESQPLARLVADDAQLALRIAEADLAHREAELRLVEAERNAARAGWEHPIAVRRLVATTEALLRKQRAELDRLPALIRTEAANHARLVAELRRIEPLVAAGAAREIELIRIQHEVEAQDARVDAMQAQRAVMEAEIAVREAELEAARENLRLRIDERRELEVSEAAVMRAEAAVLAARAAVDEARLRLDRMEIRSPMDGYIMVRAKAPGDAVSFDTPGDALIAKVYDPQRLQVRVDVPLADAGRVHIGQPARVSVEVLPDREFDGIVSRIAHTADIQRNTLQVKVAIHDPSPLLKPEMLARVKLLPQGETMSGDYSGAGVFAPLTAIERSVSDPATGSVWVVADRRSDRGRVVRRRITLTGEPEDGWIAVRSGLSPGDLLIVSSAREPTPNMRVRIRGEAPSQEPPQ